jgi:hypothetical protein
VNYPTSDALISAANGGQKTIKPDKTYMVEDIFSESAYLSVIQVSQVPNLPVLIDRFQ